MSIEQVNYNKLMAQYIKSSEKLRKEISFEDDPVNMLDKCLLCISLMTGDMAFYKENKEKIVKAI